MSADVATIANDTGRAMRLLLEPWGSGFVLEPGDSVVVEADSPDEGTLEVDRVGHRVQVWAWAGCTMRLRASDGVILYTLDDAAPEIPAGMSADEFVQLVMCASNDR